MNQRPSREETLFYAAAEMATPEMRAAFLQRECSGDAALRERVEALLKSAGDSNQPFMSSPVLPEGMAPVAEGPTGTAITPITEKAGDRIGRYKLLQQIGEGGCGVVYMAEQEVPVRRRVALKVIKLGMDTKQVVARFEAERQALALMDHPNIAKVFDAGATDTGRPFFVMELVRGTKITEFCDQQKLPTRERLDLFMDVCSAIQHAHQKGIIHRDIKPSNVLVTMIDGKPVPKVIDFGIAKATNNQQLTDKTLFTAFEQFIGTPAYMSPEQAEMSGVDIDTRSDIYSLGVLLYELLTGRTPFDATELMASGLDAMRKTIREKEPQRPSTRLATLQGEELTTAAKRRSADTSKLLHQLKGDLDWIVMKCLEKDRARRYETANGLAADLKRHLSNEPVAARPPSAAYKFQKAFRRNKVAFTAGVAVAAALLLGIIVSTWQSVRATHAKRDALSAQAGESVQRQKAEANEQQAIAARAQAEGAEIVARQRAYAADMNVAKHALDGHNLGRALDLLKRQEPPAGQRDLRGWEWRYLWQQTRSDATFTLCQESSEICSLAVAPDALTLAIGVIHEGGLSVWDLRTRQELIRLAKNESHIRAAFSPTEPLLAFVGLAYSAAGKEQVTLHIWNTATRRMIAELPLDGGECAGLAFAKDGRTLVTHTLRGHITVWRVPEGIKLASHVSGQNGINAGTPFAATPNLSLAAYGTEDGRVHVIDLHDGKELWTAVAAKQWITALAFSPDGKTLASAAGFSESDIRLWDVATGKEMEPLKGHGSWVSSLVFWPDGKKLASSCADQTLRVWEVASRKCLEELRGHRQEVWRLALLPDDRTLVSGGKDGTVCFWDTSITHPHQSVIIVPVEKVENWNFAPDGQSLLTLNESGQVLRWAGDDFRQQSQVLEIEEGTSVSSYSSCFSPDGRLLAVGWTNGIIRVWNLSQRVLLHQLTNTTGPVSAKTFLADGKKLITFSERDNLLHELDLTTGLEIQSWQKPAGELAVGLSPDEQTYITMGWEGGVISRNLADRTQTKLNLDAPETDVGVFSPNGKLFAVPSSMGFARVWETAAWKPVETLGNFLNGVHGVNFSPDGQRLAIAGHDKEAVRLCDTESWQDVFTLEADGGFANTAFSPDGNTLVWGAKTVYLWRAPSWAEIKAVEAKEKAESKRP